MPHPVNDKHRGEERTLGERAADQMRNSMGSWIFIFAFVAAMGVWAGYNRADGFDPYPFILLNLMLSTMAGLQGAILLIAAKRSDKISADLAEHDFNTDVEARDILVRLENLTGEVLALATAIHAHITAENSPAVNEF